MRPRRTVGLPHRSKSTYAALSDPDQTTARAYGVIGARWAFDIGTTGRILAIDKHVRVMARGRDIVARLGDLGVARRC